MGGMGRDKTAPTSFFMASNRLDLARQLLERYDANMDGVLTTGELDIDEATFRKADLNGDLELSGPELIRLLPKVADVEVIIRLKADKEAPVEMIKPEKDTTFIKSKSSSGGLLITFGTAHLDLRPALASADVTQTIARQRLAISTMFMRADKANRGFVTKTDLEKPEGRQLLPLLPIADRDGNGELTEKELIALYDLEAKAGACCLSLTAGESGSGLFEMMDANRDGRLTVREMRTAIERFEGGQGFITKTVMSRQFGLNVMLGPIGLGGRATPGGGTGGMGAPITPRPSGRTGPIWFRKLDSNGDGEVSKREWLGDPADFKRLDLDGDGVISPEEAVKADSLK
jgi:Ca2+-binding EF-hand superfamily protein